MFKMRVEDRTENDFRFRCKTIRCYGDLCMGKHNLKKNSSPYIS